MKFFTAALFTLSATAVAAVPTTSTEDQNIQRFYDAMAEVQEVASVLAKPEAGAAQARAIDPICYGCRNGQECCQGDLFFYCRPC
ncbi:hypothetical protein FHETE_3818 [Fusarium heterosporum]|uniref:Uncharacterized protein n=1 Tax=Fusarium heterosporum TaxID=42747 RepID=A0A8H5WVB5_FUSHE|nr:hypothetical protein FHETE_3818 [Fusarium heterosporum]